MLRLLFLRQFLARLKPIYKKLDFQISRMMSLASKDNEEALGLLTSNNESDLMYLRPNLDDLDDEDVDKDDLEIDQKTKDLIKKKAERAISDGYGTMDKKQKKSLIQAIRDKREAMSKDQKKKIQLEMFKKKRMGDSSLMRELEEEIEELPHETEKRANIAGIYDPLQERRDRMDDNSYTKTMITKKEKKSINKRVQRLKQQQRIDDLTEIQQFSSIISNRGETEKPRTGKKDTSKDKKRPKGFIENKDEEKYDSKRQHRMKRSGKLRHKKK